MGLFVALWTDRGQLWCLSSIKKDLNCDKDTDMHKQIELDATSGFMGNEIKLINFFQCTLMHLCLL